MVGVVFADFRGGAVGDLPQVLFPNGVVIVSGTRSASTTMRCLLKRSVLNISARAQPDFSGNVRFRMSLLRIDAHSAYCLFHLRLANVAPTVVQFLRSGGIPGIKLS